MPRRSLSGNLAIAGLILVWGIPVWAIANGLPDQIPLHFDLGGHVNRWGSSSELFFLPTIALLLFVLLSVLVRFPASFNYPIEVTPENRARLQELAVSMIQWLKVELLVTFAWIEVWTVRIAREGEAANLSGLSIPFMLVPVGLVLATVIGYLVAMRSVPGAMAGRER